MEQGRRARPIPPRALLISLAAFAVPVAGQLFFTSGMDEYDVLLWLLALIPAFLLAYHKGWVGVAIALATGMALISVTEAILAVTGSAFDGWPLLGAVVAVYVAVSLAIGWMSELLHRERERAESLAMIDELTGLPNRRLGRRFLEIEVAAAQRGRQVTIVMFDIDHFKSYNDTHGHLAGDEVIALMGRALTQNTRRMNLSARWGGEEFVTILSDTDAAGALVFVSRVQSSLAAAGLRHPVTFSAGVAEHAGGIASGDELLGAADVALYRAKSGGRNRVQVAEPTRGATSPEANRRS